MYRFEYDTNKFVNREQEEGTYLEYLLKHVL